MAWLTREQLIATMKVMADQHPLLCTYASIGKTVNKNDVWLFRIGNGSVKMLIDGTTHGMEQPGGHCIMYLMQWLLGGLAEANYILERIQLLLVPIVNYDKYQPDGVGKPSYRKNARPDPTNFPPTGYGCVNWNTDPPQCSGVDINRNHIRGWSPNSDTLNPYYSGPFGGSEPETQAMNQLFQTELPKVYINIHDWGGAKATNGDFRFPNFGGSSYTSECTTLFNKYAAKVQSLGLMPHTLIFQSAYGSCRDDAYNNGQTLSANWEETGGESSVTSDLIATNKMAHLRSLALAVAEIYGEPSIPKQYVFKQWNDGDTNPTKTINA